VYVNEKIRVERGKIEEIDGGGEFNHDILQELL
jgi:hypothetical protein